MFRDHPSVLSQQLDGKTCLKIPHPPCFSFDTKWTLYDLTGPGMVEPDHLVFNPVNSVIRFRSIHNKTDNNAEEKDPQKNEQHCFRTVHQRRSGDSNDI